MQRMIKEQYARTKQILTEKRELLDINRENVTRSRNTRCCSN